MHRHHRLRTTPEPEEHDARFARRPSDWHDRIAAWRRPTPPENRETWTGSRPLVTGVPVVIGAVVVGSILIVLLASLGRQPDLVAQLSQQFTAMMAGTLAPGVRITDPARLAEALRRDGLPFTVRIPSSSPSSSSWVDAAQR